MEINEIQEYDTSFLKGYQPLTRLAEFAISYLESDPNSSVIKQGMMLEHIMKTILQLSDCWEKNEDGRFPSLKDSLTIALQYRLIPKDLSTKNSLRSLRIDRNIAVHEFFSDSSIAKKHIRFILDFSKLFMEKWIAKIEQLQYRAAVEQGSVAYKHLGPCIREVESVLDYSRRIIQQYVYRE